MDAHGGLGFWANKAGEDCLGSSVMVYRLLDRLHVPYLSLVFEKRSDRFNILKSHLRWAMQPVKAYNCDNRELANKLPSIAEKFRIDTDTTPGLIFYDNDGVGSASELMNITENSNFDILIHSHSTGFKRKSRTAEGIREDKKILDHVHEYNRRNWFISHPLDLGHNHGNFFFLHGSNRYNHPLIPPLFNIDSQRGKRCQEKILYTNSEIEEMDNNHEDLERLIPNRLNVEVQELVSESPLSAEEVVETESTEGNINLADNIFDSLGMEEPPSS